MQTPTPKSKAETKSSAVSFRSWQSREMRSFLQLLALAITSSIMIAYYVLLVVAANRTKSKADSTAQAALYAAHELSHIYIDSTIFGKVGLCDNQVPDPSNFGYGVAQTRITGIDTVYRTLAVDKEVAEKLHLPIMLDLIEKDYQSAKKIESELTQKLRGAAEPYLPDNEPGAYQAQQVNTNTASDLYHNVYRMLSLDKASKDNSLIEVRIRLGRLKSPDGAVIHPKEGETLTFDSNLFMPSDHTHAPNTVLVEGTFQNTHKDNSEVLHRGRCALIAGPLLPPVRSTFVLDFPDGKPLIFDSFASILHHPKWNGPGDWQQAVGSEVPGRGSLAPSLQPVLPEMNPADALSIALYHWLKRIGPDLDQQRLFSLLDKSWSQVELIVGEDRKLTQSSEPNSCLAIDTGAREYAILNKTSPGGSGQLALCRAFGIPVLGFQNASPSKFPQSAVPLYVNQDGNCVLPGRKDFDQKMVFDFLAMVYQTNLAAVESLSVSNLVKARVNAALTQLDQKIFIERQELESVRNRLERLRREPSTTRPAEASHISDDEHTRAVELAESKLDSLNQSIGSDEDERKNYHHTNELAIATNRNANHVAGDTYELCAHTFKLCKDGISRIDQPFKGFLVSKRYAFKPCTVSVSESDFYSTQSSSNESKNPWFSHKLEVLQELKATNDLIVEGKSWSDFLTQSPVRSDMPPVSIFMTTDGLCKSDKNQPKLMRMADYPFDDIRLPNKQLFYYNQNAVTTGANPPVSWSVLIRDFIAEHASQTNTFRQTGNPIPSEKGNWCEKWNLQRDSCPGLACELQLRTPLPTLVQSADGAYLTNPANNSQMPQIPPVPADML